jgi:hypothetical protein
MEDRLVEKEMNADSADAAKISEGPLAVPLRTVVAVGEHHARLRGAREYQQLGRGTTTATYLHSSGQGSHQAIGAGSDHNYTAFDPDPTKVAMEEEMKDPKLQEGDAAEHEAPGRENLQPERTGISSSRPVHRVLAQAGLVRLAVSDTRVKQGE